MISSNSLVRPDSAVQMMKNSIENKWNAFEINNPSLKQTTIEKNRDLFLFFSHRLAPLFIAGSGILAIASAVFLGPPAAIAFGLGFLSGTSVVALIVKASIKNLDKSTRKVRQLKNERANIITRQKVLENCFQLVDQPKFQKIIEDLQDFDPEDIDQIIGMTQIYNESVRLEEKEQELLEEKQALDAKFREKFSFKT